MRMRWRGSLDCGPLMEPNRDVGSFEETALVVGFLLRLRSGFLAERSEHLDGHAELPRAALLRPCPGDTTGQQDDRSTPPLRPVQLLAMGTAAKEGSTTVGLH